MWRWVCVKFEVFILERFEKDVLLEDVSRKEEFLPSDLREEESEEEQDLPRLSAWKTTAAKKEKMKTLSLPKIPGPQTNTQTQTGIESKFYLSEMSEKYIIDNKKRKDFYPPTVWCYQENYWVWLSA